MDYSYQALRTLILFRFTDTFLKEAFDRFKDRGDASLYLKGYLRLALEFELIDTNEFFTFTTAINNMENRKSDL